MQRTQHTLWRRPCKLTVCTAKSKYDCTLHCVAARHQVGPVKKRKLQHSQKQNQIEKFWRELPLQHVSAALCGQDSSSASGTLVTEDKVRKYGSQKRDALFESSDCRRPPPDRKAGAFMLFDYFNSVVPHASFNIVRSTISLDSFFKLCSFPYFKRPGRDPCVVLLAAPSRACSRKHRALYQLCQSLV